jgi:hypothetical protein
MALPRTLASLDDGLLCSIFSLIYLKFIMIPDSFSNFKNGLMFFCKFCIKWNLNIKYILVKAHFEMGTLSAHFNRRPVRDAYSNSPQKISTLLNSEEAFPNAIRAQRAETSFFWKINSS